jgi:hypothetical protein
MVEEVDLAMVPDVVKVAEITPEVMEKMVVVAEAEAEDKVVKMDMAVVLDVDLVGEEAMDKMKEVLVATKVLVQPSLNTQRSRYNSRLGGVS